MQTQEIRIVTGHEQNHRAESKESTRQQLPYEPITFYNTPFEESGKKRANHLCNAIVTGHEQNHRAESKESTRQQLPYEPITFYNTPFEESGKKRANHLCNAPRWRFLFIFTIAVVDVISMLIAVVGVLLVNREAYTTIERYMPVWAFIVLYCIVWLTCLVWRGTYHRHIMAEGYELYVEVLNATIATIVAFCFIVFMLHLDYPRTILLVAPIFGMVLALFGRLFLRLMLHRKREEGEYKYNTVIIGSSAGINSVLKLFDANRSWGYRAVAICPIEKVPDRDDAYIMTDFVPEEGIAEKYAVQTVPLNSNFPRKLQQIGVQEVFVADVLDRDSKLLHGIALAIESLGMELALSVALADVAGHRLYLHNTTEQPILLASLPQYSATTLLLKRIFDIVLSSLALIISSPIMLGVAIAIKLDDGGPIFFKQTRIGLLLLKRIFDIVLSSLALIISSPIMLGVAIAIKLDDGGPIFFKQTRIGLHGRRFQMYKFRSMVTNAEAVKKKLMQETGQTDRFIFKMKDDPRITRVGRFIRRTSLDEFPQFLNVLKGDMSMVGPRPALPEEVARYGSLYSARLLVKPGITGPWQISGRSDLTEEQSEYLDVSYIENWSITGDIAILIKTVWVVIRGTGAY